MLTTRNRITTVWGVLLLALQFGCTLVQSPVTAGSATATFRPATIDGTALTRTMSEVVRLPTISAQNPEDFAALRALLFYPMLVGTP